MDEARDWLYEKLMQAVRRVEQRPYECLAQYYADAETGLNCNEINLSAREIGLIAPGEFIIERRKSTEAGREVETAVVRHPNPRRSPVEIQVVGPSKHSILEVQARADDVVHYLRAWAARAAESSATTSPTAQAGPRQSPRFDPSSLAATGRAARDLTMNLREVLGWFDFLRSADRDQPPEPMPWWWDGYVRDPHWQAESERAAHTPADRVRWVSGQTLKVIDDTAGPWDRLCNVIPFTDFERRKAAAARESLRNLRGILDPMQPRMGLRSGAIPAHWHLETPIPEVWEQEPESEAERTALHEAQNAAFDVAINDGAAKGAQKRLEQANAKLQRLARERGKRNDARREKARREGLVTAEERAELVAARSWWAEQIKRWELGEKDLRELLAVLTAPRDKPAPSITAPQTLLGQTLEGKTGELDLTEAEALLKLGSRELWGVDELPEEIDADVMRCLDDHGLVEARFVTMQNRSKYRGDTTPPAPVPSSWFSPMKNPSRAGEWDKILGRRLRDYWTHPSEVRLSERGRAVLARQGRRQAGGEQEKGPREPTATEKVIEKRKPSRRERKFKWLAEAMLLVQDNPDWPDARIAEEVGIDKSRLSRTPEYKAAAALARRREPLEGKIETERSTKKRVLEAIDVSFDLNRPASRQSQEEEDADDRLDREDNELRAKRNAQRNTTATQTAVPEAKRPV
jgi:hypothetical protein